MQMSTKGSIVVACGEDILLFAGGLQFEEKIDFKGDTIIPRPSMKSTLGRGRSDPIS